MHKGPLACTTTRSQIPLMPRPFLLLPSRMLLAHHTLCFCMCVRCKCLQLACHKPHKGHMDVAGLLMSQHCVHRI